MPAWPAIRRRDRGPTVSRTVGEVMHRVDPLRSQWHLAAVLCAAAVAGGCTMCPDPFDYSGPVPNGSSPQNDFRARSNGIRPLLAAPRPWPPVVQDDAGTAPGGPGAGRTSSVLVAAATADEEGSVVPVVREALEQPGAGDTDAGASPGEPTLEPVPEKDGEASAAAGPAPAVTGPAVVAPVESATPISSRPTAAKGPESWPEGGPRAGVITGTMPGLAEEWAGAAARTAPVVETPGWRPRR
jgi:hypothetical protein